MFCFSILVVGHHWLRLSAILFLVMLGGQSLVTNGERRPEAVSLANTLLLCFLFFHPLRKTAQKVSIWPGGTDQPFPRLLLLGHKEAISLSAVGNTLGAIFIMKEFLIAPVKVFPSRQAIGGNIGAH